MPEDIHLKCINIAQLFLWFIENLRNPELQINEPWSFVMETKTKKPRKDETDSWTALFPETDIAKPGYFIPKFMQFKMYTI